MVVGLDKIYNFLVHTRSHECGKRFYNELQKRLPVTYKVPPPREKLIRVVTHSYVKHGDGQIVHARIWCFYRGQNSTEILRPIRSHFKSNYDQSMEMSRTFLSRMYSSGTRHEKMNK